VTGPTDGSPPNYGITERAFEVPLLIESNPNLTLRIESDPNISLRMSSRRA
jgi:hypothetical protein